MDISTINKILHKITQGKFKIHEKDSFDSYIDKIKNNSKLIFYFFIKTDEDVFNSRNKLRNVLEELKIDTLKTYNILLVFTELATNIVKHAVEGYASVYLNDDGLYMIFIDKGKGINLEKIPFITLSNYSTIEGSLGFGFNICIELCNSIDMYTSSNGTSIIAFMK